MACTQQLSNLSVRLVSVEHSSLDSLWQTDLRMTITTLFEVQQDKGIQHKGFHPRYLQLSQVSGYAGWSPRVAPAPRKPKSLEAALLSKASAALAHRVEVANRFSRLSHK